MEKWKWIEGYEGHYQISTKGRIKSFKKKEPKILSPKKDGKGNYLMICLCKDGKNKYCLIHRLVAQAFIPNPENKEQVNHIDGNKKNNSIENLEWVSCKENIRHAYENKLNPKEVSVYVINAISGNIIGLFESEIKASKFTGASVENIRSIMSGKSGTFSQFIYVKGDTDNLYKDVEERLKNTSVIQMIDKNTDDVLNEFVNPTKAKKYLDVKSNAINNCLNGVTKTAHGYKWRYKYR